jgi:hypothetical protein
MNTNPAPATLEVVTMPSGNGWRMRIADGQRLQFVSGFDAKSAAEEWVRSSRPPGSTSSRRSPIACNKNRGNLTNSELTLLCAP